MTYQPPINSLKSPNNPYRPSQPRQSEVESLNMQNIQHKNSNNPGRLSPRSQQAFINYPKEERPIPNQNQLPYKPTVSNHVPNFLKNTQVSNGNNNLNINKNIENPNVNYLQSRQQKKLQNSGNNINIQKILKKSPGIEIRKEKAYRPSMHELSDTGNEWKSKKDNDSVNTGISQVKQSYMPSVSSSSGFNHYEEVQTHQSFIMGQQYRGANHGYQPKNFKQIPYQQFSPNKPEDNRSKTTGSLTAGIQTNGFVMPHNNPKNSYQLVKKEQYSPRNANGYENSMFVPQFIRKNEVFQKPRSFQKIENSSMSPKNHKNSIQKIERKLLNIDDFIKIKQLGVGQYGSVFLARQKYCGFICALKRIQKKFLIEEGIVEQFIRQIKIQSYLNHPNILKLYGLMHNETHIYIVLEVGLDKELQKQLQKLKTLPQIKAASYMRQICGAVQALHSQEIIHRDLKPQNIIIHESVVKICDFGWAVHHDNSLRTTFCGTPLYVAPDILKGNQYDDKVDIWSLGIMMYEMLIGQNPFDIKKEEDLKKIILDQVVIPNAANLSQECCNFIYSCLKKKSDERANIRQLLDSDFFKKYPDKKAEKHKIFGLV